MRKKKYIAPGMEIEVFEVEDIITNSGEGNVKDIPESWDDNGTTTTTTHDTTGKW